ncbi:IclR family transcriptional regulator [Alpinimonas psychrophila]|uniref:DNA-binding IclR family transcriptional regulator n=1 Tax=Alpinimonas psychrophila TaxID=748908 RepID=A0A7W3JTL9_9MICO|nr:IclR family transcriptional regulator [Alpinimonas psychrophila]MBA8828920.1 DNA-binding IclR family transcriptional regulator [Alpinimonas psychrophila]
MTKDMQSVKSAQRTLEILEVVARYREGVSFVELSSQLPYPKSSLHGLLQTTIGMRWLIFDPDRRLYSIGVKPWEVGQSFLRSRELIVRSRRFLRAAIDELGETIQLGILDDLDIIYIDKIEGTRPLRLVSNIGSRLPAYVTGIGKALLAGLGDDVLVSRFAGTTLKRYTRATITSGDLLIEVLKGVRSVGYAIDDGEYTHGVFCVAVPIVDHAGDVVAAMSCSVPKAHIELGELTSEQIISVLRRQAHSISEALRNC